MDAGDLAAERYLALVNGLLAEDGLLDESGKPKHGAISKIARRLVVNPTYLSKLLSGARSSIGMDTVDAAVRSLPIRPAYFTEQSRPGHAVDWRAYLITDVEESPVGQDAEQQAKSWARVRGAAAFFMRSYRENRPEDYCAGAADSMADFVLGDPVVASALEVRRAETYADKVAAGFKLAALIEHEPGVRDDSPVSQIKVQAAPQGEPVPWPGRPGSFVGYRGLMPGERTERADIEINGRMYVRLSETFVPEAKYFRAAIERGDLVEY